MSSPAPGRYGQYPYARYVVGNCRERDRKADSVLRTRLSQSGWHEVLGSRVHQRRVISFHVTVTEIVSKL